MIKNSTFDVYDGMSKQELEEMTMAFETDFVVADSDEGREWIKARLAIIYGLLKYKFKEAS